MAAGQTATEASRRLLTSALSLEPESLGSQSMEKRHLEVAGVGGGGPGP